MNINKILYVEDEPFLAKIVKETLEAQHYDVHHINHGDKAIRCFNKIKPDICILDVMLPGKDGFEIGRDIRSLDKSIPIIYLTAKDQTEDVIKGFSSGCNDYIRKPFSIEELIVRIENLLALSDIFVDSNLPQILKFGSLSLDTIKMVLLSSDGKVQLSHRETEIMKMLYQSIGGQIERKVILMEIWGDDSFFNSRNLDVYIRKIRKYILVDPNVELLTLKGIGYRLIT